MRRFHLIVFVSLVAVGCGKLSVSSNGDGPSVGADAGDDDSGFFTINNSSNNSSNNVVTPPLPDVGGGGTDSGGGDDVGGGGDDSGTPDTGGGPLCEGPDDCGSGASCMKGECVCDDGLLGDPYTGCAAENPCDGVDCPAGASCSASGMCECDPFFADDGSGGCTPTEPPADVSARTKTDVCDIWTSSYQRSSQDFFMIDPVDVCDPGVLHPEEMRTALHRTSVFRMLVGLYPVSLDGNRLEAQQECATMHEATNMGLDHDPPMSWECWTQAGAGAAGSSNLAVGISSPAGTVGLYVGDFGVPSLGHRRWIFNPGMAATTFGHRGRYGCMYSFGGGRSHNPDFVAYPSPGPFPRSAVLGKWSISGGGTWTDGHTVTVTNMSDGTDVPVSNITAPAFGFLASTLSWSVSTNQLPVDTDYRVRIADSGGAVVQEYTTRLVSCP